MSDERALRFPQNAAQIWAGRQKLPFVRTFSPKLNAMLGGGLRSTGCYILTGAPGAGKTTFSLDMADAAIKDGWPVIYISAELNAQLVVARYAAKQLGYGWLDTIDTEDKEKLERIDHFVSELGNYFWVLDPQQATKFDYWVPTIRAELNKSYLGWLESNGQPPPPENWKGLPVLVIVDYIQDLAQPRVGHGKDQRTAVAELSRELRAMADTQFIPLWIISSSSRMHYASNEEQGNNTLLASAKDAGEVEYDSSAVIHIRRKDAGDFKGLELVIAKNRFGEAMQTIIFQIEPVSGALKETEAKSESLMFTMLLNKIGELISQNPGKFKTATMIAKSLNCKTVDVKAALDQLMVGYGPNKVVPILNGQEGFFLTNTENN